ncbi:MAG: NAD(P)-dependent oxidoreductase [Methylococcaceae bacterium]|nr:MAG: NAD(P)-dependent oxidoreductase [Methylococcaceae bacterium]
MQTGYIGLGAMGAPMARNLAQAGFLAGVWNRTPAKALSLADELGVTAAADPAALAAQVAVVFICVSADADVLAVVEALLPGIKPGAVVVDCSTVSSVTAQRAAHLLAEKGAHFLDAPVSGGVEGARQGSLVMMVGGDAEALVRVQPVLQAVAARIVHFGPSGAGQSCKAVNQIMAAGIAQAVTEALAFGSAMHLPMEQVIDVVAGGAAGNWFLQRRGKTMVAGSFQPGFKLCLHHKDLLLCRELAQQLDMPLPVTEQTIADYATLMAQGHGDEDISALYRLKLADKAAS